MTGEDNELIAHKWVRILVDSCAQGVWEKGGGAPPVADLPVSAGLIQRIRDWQAWYDRDEDKWGVFRGDVAALSAAGLEIARAVKAELPDWTVVYFDMAAAEGAEKDGPRSAFEYAV
jgi:hypothetical protein